MTTSPIRAQVNAFCRSKGICTSCYGRKASEKYVQCYICHGRKKREKEKNREVYLAKHKQYYADNREKKKAYSKQYKVEHKPDDITIAVKRHMTM